MLTLMKRNLPTLGRLLIALIFLVSGFGKVMDPAGTQAFMAQYGMPLTGLFLTGAILVELGGGLSLLLGWKARRAAAALILFLIPATLIFHTDFADQEQIVHFLKNLAIGGGLLMVGTYGAGPLSLDARQESISGESSGSDATRRDKHKAAPCKPVAA